MVTHQAATDPAFGGELRTSAATDPAFSGGLRTSDPTTPAFGGGLRTSAATDPAFGGELRTSAATAPAFGGELRTSAATAPAFGGELRTSDVAAPELRLQLRTIGQLENWELARAAPLDRDRPFTLVRAFTSRLHHEQRSPTTGTLHAKYRFTRAQRTARADSAREPTRRTRHRSPAQASLTRTGIAHPHRHRSPTAGTLRAKYRLTREQRNARADSAREPTRRTRRRAPADIAHLQPVLCAQSTGSHERSATLECRLSARGPRAARGRT